MKNFKKNRLVAVAGLLVLALALISPNPAVPQAPIIPGVVLVRDVDNPATQPFAMDFDLQFPAGSSAVGFPGDPSGSASFTVPAGKRLVIEFATAICGLPAGQKCRLGILESESGVDVKHDLAVNAHETWGGVTEILTATQPMRIYIEPQGSVFVFGRRSDITGTGTLDFSLSGYFVDVP